jgi:hypothetical protein
MYLDEEIINNVITFHLARIEKIKGEGSTEPSPQEALKLLEPALLEAAIEVYGEEAVDDEAQRRIVREQREL